MKGEHVTHRSSERHRGGPRDLARLIGFALLIASAVR